MSQIDLDAIQRELDTVQGTYQMRFAGQPRITRSVGVMEDLIQRVSGLKDQLASAPTNGAAERLEALRTSVDEQLGRFRDERGAIAEAQKAGPAQIEATILGGRTNFIIHKYRRHFAGKNRSTRDLSLIEEMMSDLEGMQKEMTTLSATYGSLDRVRSDLDVVRSHLELFRREGDEIARAQALGTDQERGGLLGQLANEQFELYRVHFAGKSRISRRPELLIRILGNLEFIAGEMKRLRDRGLREDFNRKNIEIVEERVSAYRTELEEVRKTRAESSIDDVLAALGAAANDTMAEYGKEFAGQSRASRELKSISDLCDRMGEVERQMTKLVRVASSDDKPWTANLEICRDALAMFEREYVAIQEAKGETTTSA